jgi:protoheme ferro-lyase
MPGETHRKKKYPFKLHFIKPFFDNPSYINALAENIRPYLNEAMIKFYSVIMVFLQDIFIGMILL